MFTAEKIAPCGLDCSLCAYAQKKVNSCPGWNGYRFCDECPDFPCGDVMEKETRYADQYPLFESPIRNIRDIRENGMEAFLLKEREKWSCRECGAPISIHSGMCSECGKRYGRQEES